MKTLLSVCIFILLAGTATAAVYPEKVYQQAWCGQQGGVMEVVLPDRTRVDCLTTGHAVEVDFARKWAEGAAQAMHYSRVTGRAPGALLIIEKPGDWRYFDRLRKDFYWIKVWTITPKEITP